MGVIKLDMFYEMRKMQQDMDKLFRELFKPVKFPTKIQPLTDIKETDKEVIVSLDMPGVDKKDIEINIRDDLVEVKAEKKHDVKVEKKGMFRQERSYTGYHRVLTLPCAVKEEKAGAEYKDGVLTITLPKKEAKLPKAKKIEIK